MKDEIIEIANEAIELYEDILCYAEFDKKDLKVLKEKVRRISEIRNKIKNYTTTNKNI
ncbi:MAG: hypothetical protein QHH74_16725 [Spirochaetota bacterium]|nr:hypothetical protein [Spirochaetota bacterium]